jgi:NAD(P)-dependent dehydrogenase (short-subunit alcohol dehydrogenase family)
MEVGGSSALVTDAASGLGRSVAMALAAAGAKVVAIDLPTSDGSEVAASLGEGPTFVGADVRDEAAVRDAVAAAVALGPLRVLVHCAGRGGPVRVVDREGRPGSLEDFQATVDVNLVGSFNMLRHAAAAMAGNEPLDGDRGVCVLTASIAAWEGQIGQAAYAASKAGIVGLTLVAARDLARHQIRVCSIAPGTFETPMLARVPEAARSALAEAVPHPRRLGRPEEFAELALHVVANGMLKGETVDGAIRMPRR